MISKFKQMYIIKIIEMIKEIPMSIFIVGTTGVGKTKLSLELGKKFRGEVVNCDSKQLYKHANIMTAKPTFQEMDQVPHHMIGCLELNETCYNRNKYGFKAMKIVDTLRERQKIPIVIGGTNYYIETLLYNIPKQQDNSVNKEDVSPELVALKESLSVMTKQQKYSKLKEVDPVMAEKLHRNDEFRVTSFLQRFCETGVPPSLTYKPYTHELLDPNTLLFWVRNSNKQQHKNALEKRVLQMTDQNGLLEIFSVFRYSDVNNVHQMGIFQSIGYKEFRQLFQSLGYYPSQALTSYDEIYDDYASHFSQLKIDQKILKKCQDLLIKSTVEYCRRQTTWIRNRIFACEENRKNFFVLELGGNGDINERFQKQIKDRAFDIIQRVREQGFVREESLEFFSINKHQSINQWKKYRCEDCNIELNGRHEWQEHLKSKRHKGLETKKERKQRKRQEKKQMPKENQKQAQKE